MTTLEFLNKAYLIASNFVKVEDLEFKQSKNCVEHCRNSISLCIFFRNEKGERDNFTIFKNEWQKDYGSKSLLKEFRDRLKTKFQENQINHPELEIGL